MLWLLGFIYGGIGLLGLWALRGAVYLMWDRKREPIPWRTWVLEPILVLAVAGVVLGGVAFRVRALVSWPFLAAYVDMVQAGEMPVDGNFRPRVVGLFLVRETEALPGGTVRMITTTSGFDECGLAYSSSGQPPVAGEDTYTSLGHG